MTVAAFVARDFSIVRSYRLPFVFDGFYGFLQLAVYFFISRTFTGVGAASLGGAPSYFAFAAIGTIVALVVESASEAAAYKVRNEQLTGTFEALVAQPLAGAQLALGLIAYPYAFAMLRAVVYLAGAAVAMHLQVGRASWPGVISALAASGLAVASLGIFSAAVVLVLKKGEVLAGMALFGMTLVSGSVFPIAVLPDWLEAVGRVMPLRFALDGTRHALFLGRDWQTDVLALLGFALVALPVATLAFSWALGFARRRGSLGQY